MSRAERPPRWLHWLLVAALGSLAATARAQSCESPRPTDAEGTQGVSYGDAEVAFFDSGSGAVRVHYALSGPHAPPSASTLQAGVPDAVVTAAQAADDALAKYAELSYSKPLGDGDSPCGSNGGSDAIDLYLTHFASADGQAVSDHCMGSAPKRCAGFLMVENDFKGGGYTDVTEGLRTVVPHELFHLIQNAYDADVERWWAEGSAQWAAKQVYPDLRDLVRFLPAYFDSPWRPLNVPPSGVVTNFLYATAIWPVFLQERFDPDIVRQVFEGIGQGTDGVLPTTDAALQARGSSLPAEFLEFAGYNAATGERAPARGGYADAALYPLVDVTPLTHTEGELVSDVASGFGAFYYSLTAAAESELTLDADTQRVAALVIPIADGKARIANAKPLPATFDGDAIVVVAGQDLSRRDAPFTLRAQAPAATSDTGGAKSSGCTFTRPPAAGVSAAGLPLWLALGWFGRCRSRARSRKGSRKCA